MFVNLAKVGDMHQMTPPYDSITHYPFHGGYVHELWMLFARVKQLLRLGRRQANGLFTQDVQPQVERGRGGEDLHHRAGLGAEPVLQDLLCVGSGDRVHGVETHTEATGQQLADSREIEDRSHQFGIVVDRVDDRK